MAKTPKQQKAKERRRKARASKVTAYFHITAVENVDAILREGLKGGTNPRNRGETHTKPTIYVLIDGKEGLHDDVAMNQIWPFADVESYAVVRIDPNGVTGVVKADDVAEFTAVFSRAIEQRVISPEFLTLERVRELKFPGRRLFDIMQDGLLKKEKWTTEEWALAEKWCHPSITETRKAFEAKLDGLTTKKLKK